MSKLILDGITVEELLQKIDSLIEAKLSMKKEMTRKEESDFMTRKEVAGLLRITLPTLHDWTKEGLIKSYKIGNRVLYKELEVYEATQELQWNKHKKYRS
jgi:excisionase family DNA binding protein